LERDRVYAPTRFTALDLQLLFEGGTGAGERAA
jgi:hypothetical protein